MTLSRTFWLAGLLAATLLLAGCSPQDGGGFTGLGGGGTGGGSGSGGNDGGGTDGGDGVAGGGIGGSGGGGVGGTALGTITGFDGLELNYTHHFTFSEDTAVVIDGQGGTQAGLEAKGAGMVARVVVGDDANEELTTGTLVSVDAENLLIGPVTATGSEVRVLGQLLSLGSATVLQDPAAVGDVVEVAGYTDNAGVITATRLAGTGASVTALTTPRLSSLGALQAPAFWKLTGTVTAEGENGGFFIGDQEVAPPGQGVNECESAVTVGEWVEVRAAPQAAFAPGDPLTDVITVLCVPPGLTIPAGMQGNPLAATVQGVVGETTYRGPNLAAFYLSGHRVFLTGMTEYVGGVRADITEGTLLEVSGLVNTANGQIVANTVTFSE